MKIWKLYSETDVIWKAMLADMESAKQSIEIEQYSFWDDAIGHKFLTLLERKFKQGVKIRVLVDAYGSYPLFRSRYAQSLIAQGMQIQAFNPPTLLRPSSFFYHIHKKTLTVDSEIAWIGGLGIKMKFFGFRDSMLRFTGPIVRDVLNSFDILWTDNKQGQYFNSPRQEKISSDHQFLVNYCGYGKKEIYEEMRTNIQNAKKSIYLTTSYFFPDRNFFQLILDKAKQGIDVKIILRGKDDEFLPVRFSTSYFYKALAADIGIYRYIPSIIHAKTAIIDDQWATVGSSNLDKFSFYYNMEANVTSTNPEFVADVKEQFLSNLANCRRISLSNWEKRSLFERFIETIVWPIHNYL